MPNAPSPAPDGSGVELSRDPAVELWYQSRHIAQATQQVIEMSARAGPPELGSYATANFGQRHAYEPSGAGHRTRTFHPRQHPRNRFGLDDRAVLSDAGGDR